MAHQQRTTSLGISAFFALILFQLAVFASSAPLESTPASLLAQQTYATSHFQLAPNFDIAWSEQLGHLLEHLYETFYANLTDSGFELAPPIEPLIWLSFDNENDFSKYASDLDHFDATWLQGYYSTLTNRVALVRSAFSSAGTPVNAGVDEQRLLDVRRISHELAHQLTWNAGLLKRGVMNPVWLTEGLATNFEADTMAEAGFSKNNDVRMIRLFELHENKTLVPISQFVCMTQFRPAPGVSLRDLYAQADGLFHFLFARYPDRLRAYMSQLSTLPVGARSPAQFLTEFSDAFGDPAALDSEWQSYLDEISARHAAFRSKVVPETSRGTIINTFNRSPVFVTSG